MRVFNWRALYSVLFWGCLLALVGCEKNEQRADDNLPTRRAKMREIKVNTDLIMAALKNEALDGVADHARTIQDNLNAVIDLYPEATKDKFVSYDKEAQSMALAITSAANGGNVKEANKQFRRLVPYCGKCHEDCAFMLAPAFPEYEE